MARIATDPSSSVLVAFLAVAVSACTATTGTRVSASHADLAKIRI